MSKPLDSESLRILRGRVRQVVSPEDFRKEGYTDGAFFFEFPDRKLSYVVLQREDCPSSILRRIVWLVKHRKDREIDSWGKDWSWPVIMKNPDVKVGDIMVVRVEPVYERTEFWYAPRFEEEPVLPTKQRMITESLVTVIPYKPNSERAEELRQREMK